MATEQKVEVEGPFAFTLKHSGCDVAYTDSEGRTKNLGSLRYSERKDKWSFGEFENSYWDKLQTPGTYLIFDNRFQAAQAMLLCREVIEKNPLSDAARRWFSEKAEELQKRRNYLREQHYVVQRELRELQRIAKENNMEFDFYVDTKKEVKDLDEFMKENMDGFYEDLGKGTARTLRSLMRSVVMLIDPEAAEEI